MTDFLETPAVNLAQKIIILIVVPWCVWATNEIFTHTAFMNRGDRFTKQDGYALEVAIDRRIDALPPQDWRDRIQRMEVTLDTIKANQTRILTIIEKLP